MVLLLHLPSLMLMLLRALSAPEPLHAADAATPFCSSHQSDLNKQCRDWSHAKERQLRFQNAIHGL